jgi:hypothetical protein
MVFPFFLSPDLLPERRCFLNDFIQHNQILQSFLAACKNGKTDKGNTSEEPSDAENLLFEFHWINGH